MEALCFLGVLEAVAVVENPFFVDRYDLGFYQSLRELLFCWLGLSFQSAYTIPLKHQTSRQFDWGNFLGYEISSGTISNQCT